MTTPDAEAVAALAEATADALCYDGPDCEHMDEHLQKAKYVIDALQAAGWTLTRRDAPEGVVAVREALVRLHGAAETSAFGWHQACTVENCYVLAALAATEAGGEGDGDG